VAYSDLPIADAETPKCCGSSLSTLTSQKGSRILTLFSRITNETPASSEIIKGFIADLKAEGVLEIRDTTGTIQRDTRIQKSSDLIIRSPQKLLFHG